MRPGITRVVALMLASTWPFALNAQDDVRFTVDGWVIEGENPISEADAQAVLRPYTGPQTGLDGLQQAARALEEHLQDRGYTFYRVVLPPQSISDGAVRLTVYPFTVGEIVIEGNEHHGDDNILRSLPSLKVGESPNARELSRNLALANLNSSKRTRLTFGAGAAGELDARIEVADRDPTRVYLWANDTGTEETGRYRVGAGYHNANFLDRDQLLSATVTTSPSKPDQVAQGGLNWRMPHYGSNGLISAVAIESDVDSGTVAEVFDVRGSGSVYGLSYSKVLPRAGEYRHLLTLGVTDKYFDSDVEFADQAIGVDVRSRPLHLEYAGEHQGGTTKSRFSVAAVTNLSGGRDNDDAAYDAVRAGAQQDWSLFRFDASVEKRIRGMTVRTSVAGQYTDEPLIAGEQLGIAGVRSVRGFDEREITGDRGFFARLEVLAPRFDNGLRLGWFIDGGRVERVETAAGESEETDVVTTGLTMSWDFDRRVRVSADIAHVLQLSPAVPGDGTAEGDERAHFNVTYFFE